MISNSGGEAVFLLELPLVMEDAAQVGLPGAEKLPVPRKRDDETIETKVRQEDRAEAEDPLAAVAAKVHKRFRIKDAPYKKDAAAQGISYVQAFQAEPEKLDYDKLFSYLQTKTASEVYQDQYVSGDEAARTVREEALTWQQFDEVVKKGMYNDRLGFMDYIDPFEKEKVDLMSKVLDVSMKMTRQLLAGVARIG